MRNLIAILLRGAGLRLCCLLFLLALVSPAPARAGYRIVTIALKGDPAPGTNGTFGFFQYPSINASGQVGVQGHFAADSTDTGLWVGDEHGLTLLGRRGDAPPGLTDGSHYIGFTPVALILNDDGRVAFEGITAANGANDVVVTGYPGALQTLLYGTQAAPQTEPGTTFGTIGNIYSGLFMNGSGEIAVFVALSGPSVTSDNHRAIFTASAGTISLAAREGMPAPEITGQLANIDGPALSESGALSFNAFAVVTNNGTFVSATDALFLGQPGGVHLVAQQRGSSPAGPLVTQFSNASVNGTGGLVFDSPLSATGQIADAHGDRALFAGTPALLQTVIRSGQTDGPKINFTPGGNGILASGFYLNDAGTLATLVSLSGPGLGAGEVGNGVYVGKPGMLQAAVRTGQKAPGTAVVYATSISLELNEQGAVAVLAGLSGRGVTAANTYGLWCGLPGKLQLVIREGDRLNLGVHGVKTVSGINPRNSDSSGTQRNGRARGFNEAGQVVFTAQFTDGTRGLFRADRDDGPLTVTVAGQGTLTTGFLGVSDRSFGKAYTVIATPKPGFVFAGWSGGLTSSASHFTFAMSKGLTLQATFVPNPYLVLAGAFATDVTSSGAPAGALTVTVTGFGALSGSLTVEGIHYFLRGALDLQGHFTQTLTRHGQPDRTVSLTFASANNLPTLTTGTVTRTGASFDVTADAALAKALPAGLAVHSYTLRIPAPADPATPRGVGYAILSLKRTGAIHLAGKLGDNTAFAVGAQLRVDATTHFSVPLYVAPRGSLAGHLSLQTLTGSDVTGALVWNKPPPTHPGTQLYPGGFTGLALSPIGSLYTAPASGSHVLAFSSGTAQADLSLTDGDVATFTRTVTLDPLDRVTAVAGLAAGEKFSLTITRASGLFTGSFQNSASAKPTAFSGILLQKSALNGGAGVFAGTTKTGAVQLTPK
jgi:hypothetical protein